MELRRSDTSVLKVKLHPPQKRTIPDTCARKSSLPDVAAQMDNEPATPRYDFMTQLPSRPNDMPWELQCSEAWMHNALTALREYNSVSICWDLDVRQSNTLGEAVGEWSVEIDSRGKRYRGEDEELKPALWYASILADAANSEAFAAQEAAKKAALEKLTPEERKLLGVNAG